MLPGFVLRISLHQLFGDDELEWEREPGVRVESGHGPIVIVSLLVRWDTLRLRPLVRSARIQVATLMVVFTPQLLPSFNCRVRYDTRACDRKIWKRGSCAVNSTSIEKYTEGSISSKAYFEVYHEVVMTLAQEDTDEDADSTFTARAWKAPAWAVGPRQIKNGDVRGMRACCACHAFSPCVTPLQFIISLVHLLYLALATILLVNPLSLPVETCVIAAHPKMVYKRTSSSGLRKTVSPNKQVCQTVVILTVFTVPYDLCSSCLLPSYGCFYDPGTLFKPSQHVKVAFQCRDKMMRARYIAGITMLCLGCMSIVTYLGSRAAAARSKLPFLMMELEGSRSCRSRNPFKRLLSRGVRVAALELAPTIRPRDNPLPVTVQQTPPPLPASDG